MDSAKATDEPSTASIVLIAMMNFRYFAIHLGDLFIPASKGAVFAANPGVDGCVSAD